MTARSFESELRRLIDDYRARSLWFLRQDYYPASASERERVLALIVRHGDQEAFRRVDELRQWLSQPFSDTSAVP
jgi:hypothetical protein